MNGSKNINDTMANKKLFIKISEIADKIMQEEFSLLETEKVPLIDHGGSTTIMTTGVESLDSLLPSFETGNVYLICGRASMGKKALLFQIALNIAASTQKSVYTDKIIEMKDINDCDIQVKNGKIMFRVGNQTWKKR